VDFFHLGVPWLDVRFPVAAARTGATRAWIGDDYHCHGGEIETRNLPISEDCDSKFGIGLISRGASLFNPEQAKDFPYRRISIENPKIGRMPLIF
jgi:hypothetical protein